MSPRVRAVAGFKRFTDPQLVTTGRGVDSIARGCNEKQRFFKVTLFVPVVR